MIDEPTMGADQGGGEAMAATSLTGFMVQAMLAGPHKMVWMSATLPPKDKLPAPVAHFKQVRVRVRVRVPIRVRIRVRVGHNGVGYAVFTGREPHLG